MYYRDHFGILEPKPKSLTLFDMLERLYKVMLHSRPILKGTAVAVKNKVGLLVYLKYKYLTRVNM